MFVFKSIELKTCLCHNVLELETLLSFVTKLALKTLGLLLAQMEFLFAQDHVGLDKQSTTLDSTNLKRIAEKCPKLFR